MNTILIALYIIGFIVTYIIVIYQKYYDINEVADCIVYGLVAFAFSVIWPILIVTIPAFLINGLLEFKDRNYIRR
jgi:hypothetical protein